MVDNIIACDESLVPIVGQSVVQTTSDVFLEVNAQIEDIGDNPLKDPNGKINLTHAMPVQSKASSSNLSKPHSSPVVLDLLQNLTILECISSHSDIATRKSLRLTLRHCCSSVNSTHALMYPASRRLPTEILMFIFLLLDVKTFNAARRTCRGWMLASMDTNLLSKMLSRGGWQSCCKTNEDATAHRGYVDTTSKEWEMSQTLSRQCSLASRWTGNGLDSRSALVENTHIDFSELAGGHDLCNSPANGGIVFTSSICGKFLMVAKDTLIYVYSMDDGLLQPLTSVACPRKVLAMSMNASVGRDAVAALLEGRMGIVCELQYGGSTSRTITVPEGTSVDVDGHPHRKNAQASESTGNTRDFEDFKHSAKHSSSRVLPRHTHSQELDLTTFDAIELQAHNQGFSLQNTDDRDTHDRYLINHTWNLNLRGSVTNLGTNSGMNPTVQSMPLESGTSTIYRHLCSQDDPPRNVAICPQRRCVAFGCSAGIELHWIDALTGKSLSRWFPLTSPSDSLHFILPRPGFDSSKELRLISSAAHPNGRTAISQRLFYSQIARSFWSSLNLGTRSRQFQDYDHFHAIPLSDGHHVLFIDPSNDRLTLGCDARLEGSARLTRKVVFASPEKNVLPRIYTAATDVASGARVVVVYGDTVMLYSIPPDVLTLSRLEQTAENGDVYETLPSDPKDRDVNHWLNWWDEPPVYEPAKRPEHDNSNSIWPISLSGTEIARLPHICDMAIQTRPELSIWAFTYKSQCKTWRLRNYVDEIVRTKLVVDRSGLVRNVSAHNPSNKTHGKLVSTVAGSVQKIEVRRHQHEKATRAGPIVTVSGSETAGFTKVMPRALAVENDDWVDSIDIVSCADAWYEGDGDVVTWHEL